MKCPICGESMDYLGIQDGGGDYGDSICEEFECLDCDYIEEVCSGGSTPFDYFEDEDLETLPDEGIVNE